MLHQGFMRDPNTRGFPLFEARYSGMPKIAIGITRLRNPFEDLPLCCLGCTR